MKDTSLNTAITWLGRYGAWLLPLPLLLAAGCSGLPRPGSVAPGPPPPGSTSPSADQGDLASRVVTVLPKDAIPAIFEPRFEPAADAKLRDNETVLGLELGDEARAYPIAPLSSREIVNDVVAGQAVAITW